MGAIEYLADYTYEDYINWSGDWELIYGIAYAMAPAPTISHQRVSQKIAYLLEEALKGCEFCTPLLPIDWKISENTVVEPDNLVIYHSPNSNSYISQAPELIFEVLSKSTAKRDLTLKYNLYQNEGVKYYIVVNPFDKVAKIFYLKDGKYIKLLDTDSQEVEFELSRCRFKFDFSKVFR